VYSSYCRCYLDDLLSSCLCEQGLRAGHAAEHFRAAVLVCQYVVHQAGVCCSVDEALGCLHVIHYPKKVD